MRVVAAFLFAMTQSAAASPEYVESIAFEEVLPNDAGEGDVRASVEASRGHVVPELQLFYGIVERVGIELSVPFVMRTDDREASLGDIGGGLKFRIAPGIGAMLEARVPTGDRMHGTGEGAAEIEAAIGLVRGTESITMQGAVGYAAVVGGDESSLRADVSLAVALPHEFYVFGESRYELELGESAHRVLAGDLPAGRRSRGDAAAEAHAVDFCGARGRDDPRRRG